MSQRMIAVCIAGPLLLVLAAVALVVPLPYAAYSPGPTFDVLAKDENQGELIQVDGHESYPDDSGQIRFTTVQTTPYGEKLSLGEALQRWIDPDQAVIPYDVAHPEDVTPEDEQIQGELSMVSSQDNAVAVALEELGEPVTSAVQVARVNKGTPADGKLQVRDIFVSIDGIKVEKPADVARLIQAHEPGDAAKIVVLRNGRRVTVEVAPEMDDGSPKIGIFPGIGYKFPFTIKIKVDSDIGGPSAGLMFSLAVYDTLTPGSLTGGAVVAGTGEISAEGEVGPIGGIEQKIAGAEAAEAELFFVPADNCPDVTGLDPDLELVKATTMHDARLALEAWAEDPDAELPRC